MAGEYTPNLNLYKPEKGEIDWDDEKNTDTDTLDVAVGTEHNADGTHKADVIDATNIDFGTGLDQVSTDDIPEGTTNKFQSDDIVEGDTGIAQINFDTDNGEPALAEGEIAYNSDDRTLDFGLGNGVTLNIGQETFANVTNQTGSAFADGKPLMFAGTVGASGKLLGQLAIADGSIPPEYTIGIATETIADGADGKVTTYGRVKGIQTDGINYGEVWSDGDLIYVSPTTAGALTNVKPNAPDRCVLVAAVVNAHATTGTFLVRPTFNPKFTDLDDVNGTPLTVDGQIPVWDQTNKYFDFTENINNFYKMLGSVGQTLYFSASNVLSATSKLFIDAVNSVIKTGDYTLEATGTGNTSRSTGNLYTDDCSDISSWTDGDNGGFSASTQETFDSRETFRFYTSTATGSAKFAQRYKDIGSFSGTQYFTFKMYHAALGVHLGDDVRFQFANGTNRLLLLIGTDGFWYYTGSTYAEAGSDTPPTGSWYEFHVHINWSALTFSIYRNAEGATTASTIAENVGFGGTIGDADGTLRIYNFATDVATDTYIDDILFGDTLETSGNVTLTNTIAALFSNVEQTFITGSDTAGNLFAQGKIYGQGALKIDGDATLGNDVTIAGDSITFDSDVSLASDSSSYSSTKQTGDIVNRETPNRLTANVGKAEMVMIGDSIANGFGSTVTIADYIETALSNTTTNKGVNGDKAADVLARITTDMTDLDPRFGIVLVGTNDIANSTTLSSYLSSMTSIIDAMVADGIIPIICGIPPRTSFNATQHLTRHTWNDALRDLVATYRYGMTADDELVSPKFVDLDYYLGQYDSAGIDGNNDDLVPAYTSDNVHLTNAGNAQVSRALITSMSRDFVKSEFIVEDLTATGDAFFNYDTYTDGNVGIGTYNPDATLDVIGDVKITDGTEALNDVFTSDANGKGSWKTPTVDVPIVLSYNSEAPSRIAAENAWNGGLLALATGQPLDSTPTNIVVSKGIGKFMIVVNAGTDLAGDITITGTSVDRNTGATTASDTDTITVDALTTDTSTTDSNGNTLHAFSGAYMSSKWFTGSVTLSTTDLTLTDVDVYHVSFEQFNDSPNLTINTFDANLLTTNVAAEFDAYLYCLDVTGSKATITRCASLNVGADGETAIANKYWRLRRGNINTSLDGTSDGIWVDIYYANSPTYVEDVTLKVWATKQVSLDLT